jgi:hypothetical protein
LVLPGDRRGWMDIWIEQQSFCKFGHSVSV